MGSSWQDGSCDTHNYHPAKGLAPSGLLAHSALRFSHAKGGKA